MVIGQRYDANSGDGSFTGTMKYVKLYSRCFNTTEVINAYNNNYAISAVIDEA